MEDGKDLISRQAAIDVLMEIMDRPNHAEFLHTDEICKTLNELPSAQPEIIRCKDCKHRYVDGDRVRYNVCELNHNKVQNDDWFCADSERKEGEAE